MHQALYRKWRPATFDDVYGQDHITGVLRYEAQNGKFNHAYLFCGSRGTGKTSCAKILAKVVNCENPQNGNPCCECNACRSIEAGAATDVIEMDAASNNGVDNIRDIKDAVDFAPSSLKYRVYIIDEVHMLSNSAFNALLKTIEEPPSYVIFILATTELHKLPATIVSRCQQFDFRRISTENLRERLSQIAKKENIEVEDKALTMIAKNAQGGARDAISLLELCWGTHEKITLKTVNDIIGSSGREQITEVIKAIIAKSYDDLFSQIDEVVFSSKDLTVFWQELMSMYRDMFIAKTTPSNAKKYLDMTDDEMLALESVVKSFSRETLLYHSSLLEGAYASMQRAGAIKRIIAEMTLVKMCDDSLCDSNAALLSRISKIEATIATSSVVFSDPDEGKKGEVSVPEKNDGKRPPQIAKALDNATIPDKGESEKFTDSSASSTAGDMKNGKKTLKRLRVWSEVLESLTSESAMLAGIIRTGKAYTTEIDGKILYIIQLNDNGFTKMMVEKFKAKQEIRKALCVVLNKDISENDIEIEFLTGDKSQTDTVIDEILENSGE